MEAIDEMRIMTIIGWVANHKSLRFVTAELSPDLSVLDLGCGNGWFVESLRQRGFDIIGIDPNLPTHAETHYLQRKSAYESGFDDDTFDCIICLETIEHLEPRVYTEIKRILKRGGKLIVTTPKKRWNWFVELLSKVGLSDPIVTPHVNVVDPDDVPFELAKHGSFMFFEWWGIYRIRK